MIKIRHLNVKQIFRMLLLGLVTVLLYGYFLQKHTSYNNGVPLIDTDQSWKVEETTYGAPLSVVMHTKTNTGFWGGYKLSTKTEFLWINILIITGASVILYWCVAQMLIRKQTNT